MWFYAAELSGNKRLSAGRFFFPYNRRGLDEKPFPPSEAGLPVSNSELPRSCGRSRRHGFFVGGMGTKARRVVNELI